MGDEGIRRQRDGGTERRGDEGTRRQRDGGTERRGDEGTRRQRDGGTERRGDEGTRRQRDGGTERRGDEGIRRQRDGGQKDGETREREDRGMGGHNHSHRYIIQLIVPYDAVSPAVEVSAVVLLKDDGCFPHRKEPATQEPSPHPLLNEDHVLCEDTVSLFLQ